MKNKKGRFETANVVKWGLLILLVILLGAVLYYIRKSVLS
tara:strand:- start:162 stop:281 length:120 start_codon:yes stop_codon:yes gene_type:complete